MFIDKKLQKVLSEYGQITVSVLLELKKISFSKIRNKLYHPDLQRDPPKKVGLALQYDEIDE